MATVELSGEIVSVGEVKTFESGFRVRELVLDTSTNRNYKSPCPISFKKDHADDLNGFSAGDIVKVKVSVGGREYNGRYYADIAGFDITRVGKAANGTSAKDAADAWAAAHGGSLNKDEFIAHCKSVIGNKPSREYTADDWASVIAAINPAEATDGADDFPF